MPRIRVIEYRSIHAGEEGKWYFLGYASKNESLNSNRIEYSKRLRNNTEHRIREDEDTREPLSSVFSI